MPIRFEKRLQLAVSNGLKAIYAADFIPESIQLQETNKEFEGDCTLVVFPFTKVSKKSPEQTADDLGEYLLEHSPFIHGYNKVKGFLNLVIKDDFWKEYFIAINKDSGLLFDPLKNLDEKHKEQLLMVEYSSPNTNKPLHLGHVRNILLGFSVSQILKAAGNRVVKVNLVNDRGIHICKSMLAWQKFGHGETPASSKLKGDHLVGKYYVLFDTKYKEQVAHLVSKGMSPDEAQKKAPLQEEIQEMLLKWEAGDSSVMELWKTMNGWVYEGFDVTYKKLDVDFDKIYYESQTYLFGKKIVEEGLEKNIFFRKDDGSIWVDLTDVGLDQKVLLRADGTSVYITQDIGTAQMRFDEFPGLERLIYLVGNEQEYHFKVLKEVFKKLGRPWSDGIFHLSYGMVDLPSGKMKSREGTVVDADDLIEEIVEEAELTTKAMGKLEDYESPEARHLYHVIGMGALKYFILKVDPKKRMLFNPSESIDLNGNTGPFIQYTHARIRSVLRKGSGGKVSSSVQTPEMLSKEEKQLIHVIYTYPAIVNKAARELSPAIVANYAYDLAKSYNHFYHDHVIIDEANPELTTFRLALSQLTADVIRRSMFLLGIEVPERM